jgi:hypothetical protein
MREHDSIERVTSTPVAWKRSTGARRFLRIAMLAASLLATLLSASIASALTALVHSDTVSGSPSQEEQIAATAGYTVTVVDDATWQAMTAADFGAYDLLIIGDPTCGGAPQQAAANAATWAPVVMGSAGGRTQAGNRIVVGTDPVYHDFGDPTGARATIIREGIGFAGAQTNTTGLYLCASCSGGNGNVLTALTLLSTGAGTWTDNSSPPCGGAASLIASHPSFPTLSTASLQGWGCSVHESWPTFPTDWSALAVATDTPTIPTCGIDPSTGLSACGEAYILIAGSAIVVVSESIDVTPVDSSNPVGSSHTVTATVTSGATPVAGQLVDFTVTGVNAGASGTCVPADCKTDASGQVTFTYTDANGPGDDTIKASFTDSAGSLQAATAQKHWVAPEGCGCMDIAFVIDDTGSMAGAIGNVQLGFTNIITQALAASGGDLRMSVLSFSDTVDVDQPMTTVVADVQSAINALIANGGNGEPEASDQGLRVAVTDTSTCGPTEVHGSFRPECIKLAIMVTDALPGGCDDSYVAGVDDLEANAVAGLAAAAGIRISAIQVLDGSNDAIEAPIMLNYATVTGGAFTTTPTDGSGAESAINAIIEACGGLTVLCGDNVVNPPAEECDGTSDSACAGDCLPPGDPNACKCQVVGPTCGNGTLDTGETCDPPGLPAGPHGDVCRADCTMCGDGIVQPSADPAENETCDDGNTLQCNPIHPQQELDDCNNQCAINICDDPARIAVRDDGIDVLRLHGILVAPGGEPIGLTGNFAISLTTMQGTVFETSVPAEALEIRANGTFKYKNASAKTEGGIYALRAVRDRKTGNYKMTAIAYGEVTAPMSNMVTHVTVGGREWSVRGLWRDYGKRWVFSEGR